MSFTYDVSTNRGKVRLKLSDTDSSAYVFEDDEIDAFLSEGGTVNGAVVEGLRALIASRALRMKRFSLPGMSYDDTAQVAELRALLSMYGGDVADLNVYEPDAHPFDAAFERPTPT